MLREFSSKGWRPTRRAQRCLSLSIVFAVTILFVLYEVPWTKHTELEVSYNYRGVFHYNSKAEDGMPNLPFKNSAVRKSTDEVWFDTEPLP
ncbi:hypothetical protein HYALB_00003540 [Hymenoscyphus albidus]|uniref:Uncharacterized protein n=1 Tax=Hymenoscyphus albidus TaxID=595503 RepID=A0A9N9M2E6_9HELO|nr:hypothetical protein HYALB_00003540 [Hymenoscyphus albidus]